MLIISNCLSNRPFVEKTRLGRQCQDVLQALELLGAKKDEPRPSFLRAIHEELGESRPSFLHPIQEGRDEYQKRLEEIQYDGLNKGVERPAYYAVFGFKHVESTLS